MQEPFYLKEAPVIPDDDTRASNYWKPNSNSADKAKVMVKWARRWELAMTTSRNTQIIHSVQTEIISAVDLTHRQLNNF